MAISVNQREKLKRVGIALAVFGGLFAIILLGLWVSDRGDQRVPLSRKSENVSTFSVPGNRLDPAKVWLTQSESELTDLRKQGTRQSQELERLKQELESLRSQLHEDRNTGAPEPENNSVSAPAETSAVPEPRVFPALPAISPNRLGQTLVDDIKPNAATEQRRSGSSGDSAAGGILSLSVASTAASDAVNTEKTDIGARTLENWLPANSFIGVTLLSGANAPTGGQAQSNPIPIVLQLDDDGNLPNGFTSRVKECRISTAAYGDLPSERAYLRTEKLTCINHQGEILETALRGYVAGEDGMAGLRGPLVEKRGQYIGLSLLSGTLGGIGSGLSQGLTTLATSPTGSIQTIDPQDALEYGAWSGTGSTLEKLADWYLKRADELYPVIEIHAGRYGHVVLTEGLKLDVALWDKAGADHE